MSPESPSFELKAPDLFTAGTVGPPGQRVFYLQREGGEWRVIWMGDHMSADLPVPGREEVLPNVDEPFMITNDPPKP